MKFLLFLVLAFGTVTARCQTTDTTVYAFDSLATKPEFKGGITKFTRALDRTFHYPPYSRIHDIQGTLTASFIIEKDGSISNVIITKGVYEDIDQEFIRIMKNAPKWKPGTVNGQAVRTRYVGFPFRLALG